jgi:hypothetical protein
MSMAQGLCSYDAVSVVIGWENTGFLRILHGDCPLYLILNYKVFFPHKLFLKLDLKTGIFDNQM